MTMHMVKHHTPLEQTEVAIEEESNVAKKEKKTDKSENLDKEAQCN